MTPEEKARQEIDAMLTASGWVIQNYHWRHGMEGMDRLHWVFGVASVALGRSLWLGFADDSLNEKRAWRCD